MNYDSILCIDNYTPINILRPSSPVVVARPHWSLPERQQWLAAADYVYIIFTEKTEGYFRYLKKKWKDKWRTGCTVSCGQKDGLILQKYYSSFLA